MQGFLFFVSLGLAFAAIFLGWIHVRLGAIALALSVVLWLVYEPSVSRQAIRIDLLLLFPLLLGAAISLVLAARAKAPPRRP